MERTITEWKRYALVQPPMMMLIIAQAISSNILTDLIIYRTCSIILNINKTECLLLHENSSSAEALKIEAQVQPKTSLILMTKSIVESIIPALLSLFLGPWSDIYGRKSIILSGYIGISLTYFLLSSMTIWDINPWFLLIAYIPYACCGGFCIILLGTVCYLSDISNEQERGWQLAWMEALISITIKSLFNIHLVRKLISTCIKKRDGFNRYIVWCCIISIILIVIAMQGEMTIGFLFVSARFGWDVNKYSIYLATNIILTILGITFGVKMLVIYGGLSEETVAIFSLLSSLSSSLVQSFTLKSWHMYVSAVVGMFSGIANPMIRAILSKSVPSEDTGKIFSMTISIETLTPLVAASLYNMIYLHFMPPIYPLPVWLVSGGIYIIVIFILINIRIQNTKTNSARYTALIQNESS
ncbi:probable peptidoglycan muropeptide transporter SLC46 isoform X5 [Apis cerana]|uniref:probable peptidoglycan muropeptide transporter SLC46 isoform X5 n=1 Tax=Apis cerana TaxID=7461 RepID=UPI002B22BC3F|nr:probable peptidoglycan muropeptide transporter SLC46 isoform X5 [Apis cerana]